MLGATSAFEVHSASLSVLPLSQNPRQSSSPSADAIGAKFVSPPDFQSMYSSARYSDSGQSNGASVNCTQPVSASTSRRGWGVSSGILTLQCSAFGQKLMSRESRNRRRHRTGQHVTSLTAGSGQVVGGAAGSSVDHRDAAGDLDRLAGLDVVGIGEPVEVDDRLHRDAQQRGDRPERVARLDHVEPLAGGHRRARRGRDGDRRADRGQRLARRLVGRTATGRDDRRR